MKSSIASLLFISLSVPLFGSEKNSKKPLEQVREAPFANHWDANQWESESAVNFWRAKPAIAPVKTVSAPKEQRESEAEAAVVSSSSSPDKNFSRRQTGK